jgi:membrane protease YdiL (CAAX protease family)
MEHTIAAIVLLALFGSFWVWGMLIAQLRAGERLVPLEPRTAVPWGLVDLLAAFVIFVAVLSIALAVHRGLFDLAMPAVLEEMPPEAIGGWLACESLARLIAVAISFLFIVARSFGRWPNWNGIVSNCRQDLELGALAFLALAPLVYAIQAGLTYWFPSKHPLITLLMEHRSITLLFWASFSAVIVAPIAEEYLFRQLLQGWLESIGAGRSSSEQFWFGISPGRHPRLEPTADNLHTPAASESVVAAVVDNDAPVTIHPPVWPIFVSSATFALVHFSHGPDPIPLFVLAVGLGYLYRATHRLLPCIVVHLLLNGFSLAMLMVDLSGDK